MATKYKTENKIYTFSRSQGSFIVICSPWDGNAYCESKHASFSAAQKAAKKYQDDFRRKNPGAYGYSWYPAEKS